MGTCPFAVGYAERTQWAGGGYDWPGIHSISVDPRSPDTMLIAVSCGGAWITDDAGATWAPTQGMRNEYMPPGEEFTPIVQDPHRVARCAAAPDVVWNQHHNGAFVLLMAAAIGPKLPNVRRLCSGSR